MGCCGSKNKGVSGGNSNQGQISSSGNHPTTTTNPPQGNTPQPQTTPIQTPIPLVVRGIEPDQCDIDGGGQITITIHIQNEDPRSIPYYPRLGDKWSFQPRRPSPGTIVCHIPPVSQAGSVDLTFWREERDDAVYRVNSTPRKFVYKDRSTRKALQLGLKAIFDRLCASGYKGSQIPTERPRAAAELEESDQIAAAIIEFYGLAATRGPKNHDGPDHEAEAHVEDIVLEALSGFVWTNEHDLLAHEVGHRQNFLHICVIGDFGRLLKFLLHHGYGDQKKQERRDEFGRTASELAGQMERNDIRYLLSSTRPGPRPDPRDSYYQMNATLKLAQKWLDLRQMRSETQEVNWEPQPNGVWFKFNEPGFERNDARVKGLIGLMATKSVNTQTKPREAASQTTGSRGQPQNRPSPKVPPPETPLSPPSPLPPNNPEQHMTPNLTPPSQTSPPSAAYSKQNPGKVIQPPSLDPKRPNPAEKVQQSSQGPAPTGRRTEPRGRHESTEEMATRQGLLASGSLTRREVTASQPTDPRGPEKIELQTFDTPKSSLGVPRPESLEQQQPPAPKSFTPLGTTHPQASSGLIGVPNAPLPPNNQRSEQHTTSKSTPPSQTSPPPTVPSKQNPGGGIQPPSPPDPELSNPAGKIQQSPQGPVSTGQRMERPSLDESAAKAPIRQSPLASGFLENWDLTTSPSIALREPSTLVRPSETIGSQTSQTPKSSLGATSVPARGSQEQHQPSAPKSLTPLGATLPQVSYGPIKTPNTPLPSVDHRPEQPTTLKPNPQPQTSPPSVASSKQNPSGVIQPPPPNRKPSNPAEKLQQLPKGPVPTSQRTEKPSLDESVAKVPIGQRSLASGFLENREVTASPSIALQEPSTLVRPSENIGSQSSQTPKSSLDATAVPWRASPTPQQPLIPTSLAPPGVPHPQASSEHIKTPEKKTTSTLGGHPPVDRGSSTTLPASTPPGPPPNLSPSGPSVGEVVRSGGGTSILGKSVSPPLGELTTSSRRGTAGTGRDVMNERSQGLLSNTPHEPIQLLAVPEDPKVDVTQGVFAAAPTPTRKSRKGKEKGTLQPQPQPQPRSIASSSTVESSSQPLSGSAGAGVIHPAQPPAPSVRASAPRASKRKGRKANDDDDDLKFPKAPQPSLSTKGPSSRVPQVGNRFAFLMQGEDDEDE